MTPFLIKHEDLKTDWEMEVQLRVFLTFVLNRDEWWASSSGRFIPKKKGVSDTQWIEGWMSHREEFPSSSVIET